jgi:hypothetical protein
MEVAARARRPRLAIGLAAAALIADPLYRVVCLDRLLGREDTRVSARRWLDKNVPPPGPILSRESKALRWGRPSLEDRYEVVAYGNRLARRRAAPWALLAESPTGYIPWAPEIDAVLREVGTVAAVFDPYEVGARPVYDPHDAFFVPVAGFEGVRVPGRASRSTGSPRRLEATRRQRGARRGFHRGGLRHDRGGGASASPAAGRRSPAPSATRWCATTPRWAGQAAGGRRLDPPPEYNVHLVINAHGLRGPDHPYEKPLGAHRTLLSATRSPKATRWRRRRRCARGSRPCSDAAVRAPRGHQRRHGRLQHGPGVPLLPRGRRSLRAGRGGGPLLYNDLVGDTPGGPGQAVVRRGGGGASSCATRRSGAGPRAPRGPAFGIKPWRGSVALRLLSDRTSGANPGLHRALARLRPGGARGDRGAHAARALALRPRPQGRGPLCGGACAPSWPPEAGDRVPRRPPVVFHVPARFEVDDQRWDLTPGAVRHGLRWWRRERVFDDLREACRSLDLPLVDPRDALRAAQTRWAAPTSSATATGRPKDTPWPRRHRRLPGRKACLSSVSPRMW